MRAARVGELALRASDEKEDMCPCISKNCVHSRLVRHSFGVLLVGGVSSREYALVTQATRFELAELGMFKRP